MQTIPWNKNTKIAVIGDLILDEYINSTVSRISPEAPVPICTVSSIDLSAGGAANAARNVQLAGGQAFLFGFCGDDETGQKIVEILENDQIDLNGIFLQKNKSSIKKTRIQAMNQQLVRIDWEKIQPLNSSEQDALFSALCKNEYQAILLSDYGKGAFSERLLRKIITWARSLGIPVVVDPKGLNYTKYLHADLITPNEKEACDALSLDYDKLDETTTAKNLAFLLKKHFQIRNVLVTSGAKGMSFVDSQDNFIHNKAEAKEVYDVSGAGDTVAAVMALGMACRLNFKETLQFASFAAAKVVEKIGTQPVTADDFIAMSKPQSDKKWLSKAKLAEVVKRLRKQSKKMVFTNGCFDIIHAGHTEYLRQAKAKGDFLVVGINSDQSVKRLKGEKRPINSLENRIGVLTSLEAVDFIVDFDTDTPIELIELLCPDILIKGADWKVDQIVGGRFVEGYGGKVMTIPLVEGLSTTAIIARSIEKSGESAT